jgi:molybdopterin-guanine dinucleotide biosynthesis protein A
MGRDKALLELGGRRLIDYPLAAVGAVAGRTLLAPGERSRYAELGLGEEVLDTGPGEGPLRGLLAALEAARTPWLVALACDMPRVSPAVLERLLAHAAAGDLDACLAQVERGTQPLLAVYHTRVAPAVRAALERGERRLVAFHPGLRVESLALDELAPQASNLNTRAQLEDERERAR